MQLDWPRGVCLFLEWLWLAAGVVCLSAAGMLAAGRLTLGGLESRLEALDSAWRGRLARRFPTPAGLFWLAGIPAALALYKLAQRGSFHLMGDSAVMANVAWNALHGDGLTSSLHADVSYLSIHFAFTYPLLSPILGVWGSFAPFALAHGVCVGAAAAGAYFLARDSARSSKALAGWLIGALCLSNPLLQALATCIVDNSVFAPCLLLWAVIFLRAGRRWTALSLALALLTTREEVPILLFGCGVALLAAPRERGDRRLAAGVMAASLALWLVEMALIERARRGQPPVFDFWPMFAEVGGSPGAVVRNAALRPWVLARAMLWPPEKVWTVVSTFAGLAFLPAAAGPALLPAAAVWVPHQLADPSSNYHLLRGHYPAMLLGPLVLAAAAGWARLWERAGPGRRRLLAAWTLAAAGTGFLRSGDFLPPEGSLPRAWRASVPAAAAHIPPDAKLWCDPYLTPEFALRRRLKTLSFEPDAVFRASLFVPDRVLVSDHWRRRARPDLLARLDSLWTGRGYREVFRQGDLAVLAPPASPVPLEFLVW